jgi:hypothetical protein
MQVNGTGFAGGITMIGKFIQFAPELGIPLGAIFTFLAAAGAKSTSYRFYVIVI